MLFAPGDLPAAEENWPFRVSGLTGECLNFLVVCGFDDEIVGRAANGLVYPK
jgi:hypothetical protein